jgi:hypothetical protein
MLTGFNRRIRDVAIDSKGAIWLVTDHEDGEVLRLTPEGPLATGLPSGQGTGAHGGGPAR